MNYGLNLPTFDDLADPRRLADLALEAELANWDGMFLWDHVYYRSPVRACTDPWVSLAAMAAATTRILLGPMVTPLARRRPQILARQMVALHCLSNGRYIQGVGLGLDASGGEFAKFGEELDVRLRAEIYDEAIDLVTALVSGSPVNHDGKFFTADDVTFLPSPTHQIPLWVAARWPNLKPLTRAAMRDGLFIIDVTVKELPAALAALAQIRTHGIDDFDVIVQESAISDPLEWEHAGATWWLRTFDPFDCPYKAVLDTIRRGPPR